MPAGSGHPNRPVARCVNGAAHLFVENCTDICRFIHTNELVDLNTTCFMNSFMFKRYIGCVCVVHVATTSVFGVEMVQRTQNNKHHRWLRAAYMNAVNLPLTMAQLYQFSEMLVKSNVILH